MDDDLINEYALEVEKYISAISGLETAYINSTAIQAEHKINMLRIKMENVRTKAIDAYVIELKKCSDIDKKWSEDIKGNNYSDVYKLDILFDARLNIMSSNTEVDLYILNHLLNLMERNIYKPGEEWLVRCVFEYVLDTAEQHIPEYINILERIFKLRRSNDWYDSFSSQLEKLLNLLPVNKKSLNTLVKLGPLFPKQFNIGMYISYIDIFLQTAIT